MISAVTHLIYAFRHSTARPCWPPDDWMPSNGARSTKPYLLPLGSTGATQSGHFLTENGLTHSSVLPPVHAPLAMPAGAVFRAKFHDGSGYTHRG